VLYHDGDVCDHLCFLLSGTVTVDTRSDDGTYTVTEQLSAPFMLQPESIFGYQQRYTHSFRALTPVSLLRIHRSEVVRLTEQFLIFRINLLNLLATRTQKLLHQPWRHCPQTLRERIIRFMANRCIHPAGPKTFHILMTQLAAEVGDSRLDVSRALNVMQRDGLLTLHRGRIEVPHMERLLQ
jgi:CRP-like cAMP-binding protein